jgi:hypothetical protein
MGRHDSCLYAVTVLEYEDDETVPPRPAAAGLHRRVGGSLAARTTPRLLGRTGHPRVRADMGDLTGQLGPTSNPWRSSTCIARLPRTVIPTRCGTSKASSSICVFGHPDTSSTCDAHLSTSRVRR